LEAWEKVLIDGTAGESFLASVHGQIACTTCHGGSGSATEKDAAHANLVTRPTESSAAVCSECHFETSTLANSLHGGLWGEKNLVAARYGADNFDDLPESVRHGYAQDCGKCHTSCGDCHVSRPPSVGGGFIAAHKFGSPDMANQCTACHGSRVGAEYRGENEGFRADAHYLPGGKRCTFCHGAEELHGTNTRYEHRLDVIGAPQCEDCHQPNVAENRYHEIHWNTLQCQICHSQDYKSCNTCHAGSGLAAPSYMSFKIGKNPVPDKRRYEYVLLRHIPIAPDSYQEWGVPLLSNFATEPTWRYAAPHNVQRWTERTAVSEGTGCLDACHLTENGVTGFFLRQADLDAMSSDEAEANHNLIVPDGSPTNW
jgi:thiosulfate/3-mercaptopyruvate sulfurtransferase